MAFGYNSFKNFDEQLSSLADEINNSQNSINEHNVELCKVLDLIHISLQDLKDEIHYLGQVEFLALLAIKGGNENESKSSER